VPGLRSLAIAIQNIFWLAADIKRLGRLFLHAVGQLKAMGAGVEGRVEAPLIFVVLVERGQSVELPPLYVSRQPLIADVLDELVDFGVLRIDIGSLIHAG